MGDIFFIIMIIYFYVLLQWAEGNTNLCRRLRLIDIIITPMQRLTRYALLLRRIKEKSTIEEQKNDLQEMVGDKCIFFKILIILTRTKGGKKNVKKIKRY